MDAREIAEGISDGINALHALLAAAGATHDALGGAPLPPTRLPRGSMPWRLPARIVVADLREQLTSIKPRQQVPRSLVTAPGRHRRATR